jgi:hypothetical protein
MDLTLGMILQQAINLLSSKALAIFSPYSFDPAVTIYFENSCSLYVLCNDSPLLAFFADEKQLRRNNGTLNTDNTAIG